jgi:hypothetical protein
LIGAFVRNRRHKAMRQVTVRHMQLDLVESDALRTLGG